VTHDAFGNGGGMGGGHEMSPEYERLQRQKRLLAQRREELARLREAEEAALQQHRDMTAAEDAARAEKRAQGGSRRPTRPILPFPSHHPVSPYLPTVRIGCVRSRGVVCLSAPPPPGVLRGAPMGCSSFCHGAVWRHLTT
jgi:hypothetical protein